MHAQSPSTSTLPRTAAAEWRPVWGNGFVDAGYALLLAAAISAPILGIGGWVSYDTWKKYNALDQADYAHQRLVAAAPQPALPVKEAAHGRDLFATACTVCHGATGQGVPMLGRNLAESNFIAGMSDEELARFLTVGRPDAKPPMPPKAGREDLTDADLKHIVVFLRGLQDPRRMPELPAPAPIAAAAPTEADKAKALEAAGGNAELAGYIASGTKLFNTTCIACHGPGGVGIKGNGKALAKNDFVRGLNDDALLAFVKRGRDPSDPKNTTGIAMPPKGGNPALSDDDLLDIIAYLRTLQGERPAADASK